MPIKLVMPSKHLILCYPLLLLPSIIPSIRVFPNESVFCIRWPNYWSLSISPSTEYSGLIFFRMDWLDLLAVQGTLKSHLQHHSSKASILWLSAFFGVQLSHPYMTTGKTIALTIRTLISKVMSLLLNTLSRLIIAFLPKSKGLLNPWWQSPTEWTWTWLVMRSNHLILCFPLLLLPSIFPSIRVFYSELALCIKWPKYWSFSFSISPSNECSGLISFRIDLLDLLTVQRTLKSLLQHHSSKA